MSEDKYRQAEFSNTVNTAMVPVPNLERDCYDWHARHEAVRRVGRIINPEIIQMGVFPRGQSPQEAFRPKIAEINRRLAETAIHRNVYFLDIGPKLVEPDGTLSPEIMGDFTHPTEEGCQIWADALMPLLAE